MRIGHGYDAHRFTAGRPLILAGVHIPHDRGLAAHSDGDAAIHALCDALLGAAGLGDIGTHFPDTDARFKDMDSRHFLEQVHARLQAQELGILNVDLTILTQSPKLAPHLPIMCARLAEILGLAREQVNVKAGTTEGMGFIGRGEGLAVHAVVLLQSIRV